MELDSFQEKFERHLINRKKINALINYAKAVPEFEDWWPIEMCCRYTKAHFLDETAEAVLDACLLKHGIDWTYWCHQTQSLKKVIQEMQGQQLNLLTSEEIQKAQGWNHRLESYQNDLNRTRTMRAG